MIVSIMDSLKSVFIKLVSVIYCPFYNSCDSHEIKRAETNRYSSKVNYDCSFYFDKVIRFEIGLF